MNDMAHAVGGMASIAGSGLLAALLAGGAGCRRRRRPTAAPATPPPQPRRSGEPRPAIWLLADDDTRIYLFGTVHILHPAALALGGARTGRSARRRSWCSRLDDAEMARAELDADRPMLLGKPVPMLQRVTPERREALGAHDRELRPADGSLDRMQTWAAALILGVGQMAREYAAGRATAGAERAARRRGGARPRVPRRRPADLGVETAADQIGAFRGMPLAVQQAMLDETVDAYAQRRRGRAIPTRPTGSAAISTASPPEIEAACRRRCSTRWCAAATAAWTDVAGSRGSTGPGTVLFAVGAGHLAGRDSVQSMLARGLRRVCGICLCQDA